MVLAILALAYYAAKDKYHRSSQERLTMRSRHLSAALFDIFYVYSSVSSPIIQTFRCEYIHGSWYLQADNSVSCVGNLNNGYMVYAGVMAIVYPIGIPAVFCRWLVRNRSYLKASDRQSVLHLHPFRGIWGPYRPSRYCYKKVEYCRRLTLSVSSVFIIPYNVNQIAALSLAAGFLFVSEALSPSETSVDMGGSVPVGEWRGLG